MNHVFFNDKGNIEIKLDDNVRKWLEEMAMANEGVINIDSVANALNGALVQGYMGWGQYKERIYASVLAERQSIENNATAGEDTPAEQVTETTEQLVDAPINPTELFNFGDVGKHLFNQFDKVLQNSTWAQHQHKGVSSTDTDSETKSFEALNDSSPEGLGEKTKAAIIDITNTLGVSLDKVIVTKLPDFSRRTFSDLVNASKAEWTKQMDEHADKIKAATEPFTIPPETGKAEAKKSCACGNPDCSNEYTLADLLPVILFDILKRK